MKRFTAWMLALVMSLSLVVSASASGTSFTIGAATANVGDTIYLPVTFTSDVKVRTIGLGPLEYNETVLEFTGFENRTAFDTFLINWDKDKKVFNVGWITAQDFSAGVKVCDLCFKVIGEGNCSVTGTPVVKDADNGDIEVSKPSATVTAKLKELNGITFSGATYSYDGTEKALAVAGTLPEGASVSYNNEKGKAVGTYNATATVTCEGYRDLTLSATLTITPRTLTISDLKAENKTYDGTTAATLTGGTLTGVVSGDDVQANIPTAGTFTDKNAGQNIAVSIAAIELTGEDVGNYSLTQPTGLKANIAQAPLAIKANDKQMIKGGTLPTLDYTVTSGQLFASDAITGSLAVNTDGDTVGSFDIVQGTLTAGNNYDLAFTKGTLTVSDKTPQHITVSTITEKTYGDDGFRVDVTPDSESGLTEFTFESTDTNVAEIDGDGNVTIKAAGTTEIVVRQAGNDEYAAFESRQTLLVARKAVEVTEIDLEAQTAELSGLLEGDTGVRVDLAQVALELIERSDEATTARVKVTNFILAGEKSENYHVATTSLECEIAAEKLATVTITAENGTVTGAGVYLLGSNVTVTAKANSGYRFSGWYVEGKSVSAESTYTFKIEADMELTAQFEHVYTGGGDSGSGSGSGSATKPAEEGCNGGANCPSRAFTDLAAALDANAKIWWHEATDYVIKNGLMNGVGNNEFKPDLTTTRAMIVTTLYRIEGSPAVSATSKFPDVAPDMWYTNAVIWATENGIVKGYSDGTFAPDDVVTREQIATIFYRYAQYKGIDVSVGEDTNILSYTDALTISDYAFAAMQWANGSGLMLGRAADRLAPDGETARSEMAMLLYRWCAEFAK